MNDAEQRFREYFSSSTERPLFLIVCDHGVRGDHAECDHTTGCKEVDRVGVLPWFPNRPGWWAAEGVDSDKVIVWPLNEDVPGHDPWDIMGEPEPDGGDPNRTKIEVRCREQGCRTWALRADDTKLQVVLETVLSMIVEQPAFVAAHTLSVSNSRVVVTLRGVWFAERHAADG